VTLSSIVTALGGMPPAVADLRGARPAALYWPPLLASKRGESEEKRRRR